MASLSTYLPEVRWLFPTHPNVYGSNTRWQGWFRRLESQMALRYILRSKQLRVQCLVVVALLKTIAYFFKFSLPTTGEKCNEIYVYGCEGKRRHPDADVVFILRCRWRTCTRALPNLTHIMTHYDSHYDSYYYEARARPRQSKYLLAL